MDPPSNPASAFLSRSTGAFKEFDRHRDSPAYTKKRKLSADGSESETTISSRKDSLNDNFAALTIGARSDATDADNGRNSSSDLKMRIPKPIKLSKTMEVEVPNVSQESATPKKEDLINSIFKTNATSLSGITKYLDLDLGSRLKEFEHHRHKDEANKRISTSIITSFFNTPYSMITTNMIGSLGKGATSGLASSALSYSGASQYSNSTSQMVGPLTREERMEKIQQFLEKKKARRWKHVRYNIRKDLADKRERVQGRFVKTKKGSYGCDDYRSEEGASNGDSFPSLTKKTVDLMNSDLIRNNLSDSSVELRRSGLSQE